MIEAQESRREAPDFDFMVDVCGAEDRGGERNEGRERDEIDVKVVDDHDVAAHALREQKQHARPKGEAGGDHIERRAEPIVRHEYQYHHRRSGNPQNGVDRRYWDGGKH